MFRFVTNSFMLCIHRTITVAVAGYLQWNSHRASSNDTLSLMRNRRWKENANKEICGSKKPCKFN